MRSADSLLELLRAFEEFLDGILVNRWVKGVFTAGRLCPRFFHGWKLEQLVEEAVDVHAVASVVPSDEQYHYPLAIWKRSDETIVVGEVHDTDPVYSGAAESVTAGAAAFCY